MTSPSSPPAASPPSSASSSSLHLVILAAREGWHTRELTRALEARGHTGAIVPYEGLVASIGRRPGLRSRAADLDRADAVLARIIPSGSLEQIIYRVDALHRLEDRGVRVMNSPRAIERTVDKFWTSALLEQCGLPTPDTIVCETPEEAIAAFRALRRRDREAAVRLDGPGDGAGQRRGHGVPRVQDHRADPRRLLPAARRSTTRAATSAPSWWAAGCWPRSSGARDGWRTNLSRGGTARPVELCRTRGARSPCGPPRPSARSTPAWTCCRRATARCTCSR